MHGRLRPEVLKCHHEVILVHKLGGCIMSDNSAKKTHLLHGCNLALLGLLLCTTLLSHARSQEPSQNTVQQSELLSYEGQPVSSVELAGQPDLNLDEFMSLLAQQSGEEFSTEKVNQTINALRQTGRFTDISLDLRPEQEGVRVVFILQPAVFFGMYRFPGAEQFPYARLLQVSNYVAQEPYSAGELQKAEKSILAFLQRNGYFESQVKSAVQVDRETGLANVNFQVTLKRLAKFGEIVIQGATPEEGDHLKGSLRSLRARLKLSAIREGKNYSLKALENATQFLEAHLQAEDHLAAQVKLTGAVYNPETNRADISFDVQTGPIVHPSVEGARLWPWTRHKLLPVYQQSGLTPELIQEGRQNLMAYFREKGFFDVQVETEARAQPDGISILYQVDKGKRKRIEGAEFTGNKHFDEDELQEHVRVKEASLLSKGSYDGDSIKTLQAFYQSKGYNQVKVTPQFNTKGDDVVVTFVVEEGPQDIVETFRIEGNATMSVSQLAPDGLRLAPGQPYAQKSIDEDRNKIISHYLEEGYLTATFRTKAEPLPNDEHKFEVIYEIQEGPQVKTNRIVTIGQEVTKETLINKQIQVSPAKPLNEREILSSESRLYSTGVFDWAEVNPRRQITTQEEEDVIVKVHESKRNSLSYGFGYEVVSKGGSVPSGTVAVPGLPPIGLPSAFKTNQKTVHGPRVNFQYLRNNVRGKAETITIGGLYGPLDRRGSFAFTDPNFRWTSWTATLSATGEINKENPIFDSRTAQFGFQLQKPINAKQTQTLLLRYTLTQTGLRNLLIPELVPQEDLHTRLSTLAAVWIHETRDNPIDAHRGIYQSFEFDLNPAALGSDANFAKILGQSAYYKNLNGIVWASSLRAGFLVPFANSHVPLSQRFFSGGGSTLRGFPLNAAGPQRTITACGDPSNAATCAPIVVPTGGNQLFILNTELRFPVPLKKGLSFVTFYDGGNVFDRIDLGDFARYYSNSIGIGVRYATPVGPIRFDIGRNLTPVPGIKPTQFFITLGQAF